MRTAGQRPLGGLWYLVVPIVSFGLLASVPFWHAFHRLAQRRLLWLAVTYTALTLAAIVLIEVVDPRNGDETSFLEALPGLVLIGSIVASVIQLVSIRRQVFGTAGRVREAQRAAVARTNAARQAREEARALFTRDPSLAWELGIGRPDLGRGFDDGGLVHLNTAPASVITQVCGIDPRTAQAIVDRREAAGAFLSVGDVLVDIPMSPTDQAVLRERAIV